MYYSVLFENGEVLHCTHPDEMGFLVAHCEDIVAINTPETGGWEQVIRL